MDWEQGQANLFEFKKENVKDLAQVLRTLMFREYGIIYCSPNGLKIMVEDESCQQANAYLDSSLFSHFTCREDDIKLRIPIKTLAECLNIAEGTASSVRMTYSGFCDPLRVLIEEHEGFVVRAKIHTLVPEQELDFEFQDKNVVATCMLKTQMLKDIFRDFDTSSKTVEFSFSSKFLMFSTNGDIGDIEISIPSKSIQMDAIKCENDTSFSYRMPLIQRMIAAVSLSSKVVFRVDDRGVLCAQFTVAHNDTQQSYIEFLTVPNSEEE